MKKPGHRTLTPWRVGDAGTTVFGPPNGNPSPFTVATGLARADASLIVRAVNNHAALVAALIRLRDCPDVQMDVTDAETDAAREQASAAIRAATNS